jgi:hypothetical protein
VDHGDRAGRAQLVARHVAGAAVGEVLVERLRHGRDVPLLEQRLGHVRAPDRRLAGDLEDPLSRDLDPDGLEVGDDRVDPRDAPLAEAGHLALERLIAVVQEQAEHVNVAAGAVGPQLHAGDHLDAEPLPLGGRLADAGGRVMVGQRHPAHAARVGQADELGRGEPPVRLEGMQVQIDLAAVRRHTFLIAPEPIVPV